MADYIRETILSQGYAHIDVVELTEDQRRDFEVAITSYQGPRAKVLLGANIVPEVKTKDGSLIVYTTVYGSLSDAIGETDDFHKALSSLYGASKMLADGCNLESLFLAKGKKKDLIRSEARTGVVKSTKDLFDKVDFLSKGNSQESQKRLSTVLFEIDEKMVFLNQQLTHEKDRQLVWSSFLPLLKKFNMNFHQLQKTPDDSFLQSSKEKIAEMIKQANKFILEKSE